MRWNLFLVTLHIWKILYIKKQCYLTKKLCIFPISCALYPTSVFGNSVFLYVEGQVYIFMAILKPITPGINAAVRLATPPLHPACLLIFLFIYGTTTDYYAKLRVCVCYRLYSTTHTTKEGGKEMRAGSCHGESTERIPHLEALLTVHKFRELWQIKKHMKKNLCLEVFKKPWNFNHDNSSTPRCPRTEDLKDLSRRPGQTLLGSPRRCLGCYYHKLVHSPLSSTVQVARAVMIHLVDQLLARSFRNSHNTNP